MNFIKVFDLKLKLFYKLIILFKSKIKMSDQRSNPGLSKQLSRKSVDMKSQASRVDGGNSFKGDNNNLGGGAD